MYLQIKLWVWSSAWRLSKKVGDDTWRQNLKIDGFLLHHGPRPHSSLSGLCFSLAKLKLLALYVWMCWQCNLGQIVLATFAPVTSGPATQGSLIWDCWGHGIWNFFANHVVLMTRWNSQDVYQSIDRCITGMRGYRGGLSDLHMV